MKTKVIKRVVALALAALILLGTLGYFFSMVGYAAETEVGIQNGFKISYDVSNIEGGSTTIANGKQASFKITLEPQRGAPNLDNAKFVGLDTNKSSFAKRNGPDFKIEKNAAGNYEVTLQQLVYNAKTGVAGKLAFNIKEEQNSPNSLLSLEFPISECEIPTNPGDDNKPGGDEDPGDEDNKPSLTTNMSYTIKKISRGSTVTYDSNDPKKDDPTIARNYYVDALVQFPIPNAAKADIVSGDAKVKILVDRGSFRFQSGTDSSIHIDRVVETSEGGVICYVTLKGLRYTGTGNTLAFTVQSKDDKAEPYIYQQFSAEVSSCEPYVPKHDNDDDDPDDSRMEMATPYVIVNNYNYGGTITAGDTFPLSITLFNTSKSLDVQNMMVTITMPEAFMLTSSSNTFYIEDLESEGMVTKTMNVTAKANAAPQSHNIEVSMKYQYVDDHLNSRRDNTTQETISIPVVQVDRFQVTGVDVSAESYVGEEASITVNFVNKGRSDVYNLSAEISGDIQNPGQQQNLGNLTSGSTGTADFYVMPNGEGMCSGEIKITYEDTNMEEKEATIQWSTNVVDPMAGMDFGPGIGDVDPGMMEDPGLMEEEKPSWPFIAGGVGAGALVVGLLVWRHIKKKRSEAADADL